MPPKHCCCEAAPRTCLVAEDDFNRPDSTNLGIKWVEVTGDAEIDNNQLNIISTGTIVTSLRQQKPVVGSRYNLRINVELIYEAGKSYGIICGFEDENNFDWIRFSGGTEFGPWYPEFIRRTGGVDNVLMDISTHPQGSAYFFIPGAEGIMRINICYADVEWSVFQLNGPSENSWMAEEGPSVPTCGGGGKPSLPANPNQGLVGFTEGRFDNFFYYVHWESDPLCQNCTCFCQIDITDYLCLEEELTLTLYPIETYCWDDPVFGSGCCDPAQVLTFTMYQQVPSLSGGPGLPDPAKKTPLKRFWYTNRMDGENPGGNFLPDELWAALICETTRDRISLAFQPYPVLPTEGTFFPGGGSARYEGGGDVGAGYHLNTAFFIEAQSTCSPLNLVFPIIEFPRSAPSSGQCDTAGGIIYNYGVNGIRYQPVLTI